PAEPTKHKRLHELPMSRESGGILERQPRKNEFVWGRRWTSWSRHRALLGERLNGMQSWRLHDLRRTAATTMAEIGVLPHIVEAALNHISGAKASVAGVYNRAAYAPEKKAALERWAAHIEGHGSGRPRKGVPLRRGGLMA